MHGCRNYNLHPPEKRNCYCKQHSLYSTLLLCTRGHGERSTELDGMRWDWIGGARGLRLRQCRSSSWSWNYVVAVHTVAWAAADADSGERLGIH